MPIFGKRLLAVAIAVATAEAQFDVASIKPTAGGPPLMGESSPGTFVARNAPLRALIRLAYDVRGFQVIGGPAGSIPNATISPRSRAPQFR
jgi:hypothetical protein